MMGTKKRTGKTLNKDIFDELLSDDIKKDTDIISIFNDFGVTLNKKGKSYIGLCPFHDDKNPSLSVDKDKGLYNCFGCGESGDVITLIEKIKGLSFKEALTYLKERKSGNHSLRLNINDLESPLEKPVKENDAVEEIPDLTDLEEAKPTEIPKPKQKKEKPNKQKLFQEALKVYRSDLETSLEPVEYLESRGLKSKDKHSFFHIGYCNGKSFINRLSEDDKKYLIQVGILTKQNRETFSSCLVFPVYDELDNIVNFYGRSINPDSKYPHLYLKGKHRSIFNRKASKVYPDSVILTECIIDTVSLAEIGFNNVQSCYGTNGYTDEMTEIHKTDNVTEIIIAFDNDKAGKEASEKLKERLVNEGFQVKCIFPPHKKDWNEELLKGITENEINELIKNAEVFSKEEEKKEFIHREDKGSHFFTFGNLHYRLTGVKEMFVTNLKVNIRAEMDDLYFPDSVDLCTYRSRLNYSSHLAGKFDLEPEAIENHLLKMLRFLEKNREKKLNPEVEKKVELTEREKKEALAFLKSSNIAEQTINDITLLGYAGEDSNKLLTYVIGLSRYMKKPLSLYVLSSAGTGKSYLVDTVTALFPKGDVKHTASMSDQAFHYMPDENFNSKIYVMGEDLHSPIVEGHIRQMQTEGRLTRDVVQKDEKTGEMQTVNITHKVKLVFMSTSTKMDVNIENLSRCILLKVDESAEQTNRVLEAQRENDDFLAQLEKEHLIPGIIKKHIASQSLLKQVRIYNPYSKYIQFPTHKALFRRSQPYFLFLIKTICYWRQYQKKSVLKKNPYTGSQEEWYECDLYDYELARRLFLQSNLLSYVEDLPQPLIELYEAIRVMVRKKAKEHELSITETSFIQRELREITGLKNTSIKVYLKMLVEYEYIQLIGGRRHGTRFSYKLREDSPIDQVNTASIIPTEEQIQEMIKQNKS